MGRTHLVLPDPHAHPDFDNERFTAIGRFILAMRPDVVVCLGDFWDMPSLSSYDRGKRSFEGRRYERDISAGREAQSLLWEPIRAYNAERAKQKEKKYKPHRAFCMGNHEDRIDRCTNDLPELHGTVDTADLCLAAYWDEVVPFKSSTEIDGIGYSHYFSSGVSGRPISGENIGKTLCNKLHKSSVQGHSHIFDHSERSMRDGQKLFGLSAGCLTHPKYREGWCADTVHMWWRGVVWYEVDGEGYYDQMNHTTLRKIEREYGGGNA